MVYNAHSLTVQRGQNAHYNLYAQIVKGIRPLFLIVLLSQVV